MRVSPPAPDAPPSQTPAKAATMEDVARLSGVALSTASGAFTGKKRMSAQTRETILQAARTLRFEPNPHAQRLSQQKVPRLACVFTPYLDRGVTTQKIKRVQYLLGQHGLEVPVYTCGSAQGEASAHRQSALLKTVTRQKPEAIVCFTGSLETESVEELGRYQTGGGILVCFDHRLPLACDHVLFDREDNGYQAAHYLLSLGHTRLGFYSHGLQTNAAAFARRRGFDRALRDADRAPETAWQFVGVPDDNQYEIWGAKMGEAFLILPPALRPTALCGMPDLLAASFIAHVQQNGGVCIPYEVSVVSTDNTPLGRYNAVPLTTTTHPVEEISQAVVDLLVARRQVPDAPPQYRTVTGEIIVRKSTAAPPPPPQEKGHA